jgi:hypothetical protein
MTRASLCLTRASPARQIYTVEIRPARALLPSHDYMQRQATVPQVRGRSPHISSYSELERAFMQHVVVWMEHTRESPTAQNCAAQRNKIKTELKQPVPFPTATLPAHDPCLHLAFAHTSSSGLATRSACGSDDA